MVVCVAAGDVGVMGGGKVWWKGYVAAGVRQQGRQEGRGGKEGRGDGPRWVLARSMWSH